MKKVLVICAVLLMVISFFVPSPVARAGGVAPGAPDTAVLAEEPAQEAAAPEAAHVISEKDIELIAKVVYGEARGECFLGKVAVANVALNRLESGRYGKSLSAILRRPHQFAVAKRTNKACLDAVHFLVDNHLRILPKNAYYFKTSACEWRGLIPWCRIHGHVFFTAGQAKVDMADPFVNDQGILVWPNASLWDEKNRTQFIIDKLFVAGSDASKDSAEGDAQSGSVAPTQPDTAPVIDFKELDRLKAVFKKYERLLGKDTLLL